MNLDPRLGKAVFVLARLTGMAAHVLEEYKQGNSYYRLDQDDIEE
ncbi:MAG: hypothetical protein G01um1014107_185 [Parcubacteria group bacterium Gr01-1014_107]|nr:MAG: hypothetical protein G01um1014107_185 [Parcubacteria group bacterium Gr01-1014_107]